MPIEIATFASYYTGQDWNPKPPEAVYEVNAFVKALKGKRLNNVTQIPVPRRDAAGNDFTPVPRYQLDESNKTIAYDMFAAMVQHVVGATAGTYVFVPVPCSKCDSQAAVRESGPMKMAEALARRIPNSRAHAALWFDQKHPSAHEEGGTRDPAVIYPRLQFDHGIPRVEAVLIDDVCTSSGHIQACVARLRGERLVCNEALCAVQSDDTIAPIPWRTHTRIVSDWP